VPAGELAIMRRIDALHLDHPFAGSRMLRDLLRGEGVVIGRERVATMTRRMGIAALGRRPSTSGACQRSCRAGLVMRSPILSVVGPTAHRQPVSLPRCSRRR